MYPNDNYSWLNLVYMFGGLYDPFKFTSIWKRIMCLSYNIFQVTFCLIFFFSSELAYLDQTMDDLYKFLNSIGLFFTHTLGVLKWIVMLNYVQTFYRMQRKLSSEQYHYDDFGDFKPGKRIFKCRKFARITISLFILLGCFVPLTKCLNFIEDFGLYGQFLGIGNVTCREFLPFYSYIPFNIDSYWMCVVGFVFQSYPVFAFVGPIISFDLTFIVITIYVCGNFMNIRDAFDTMRGRCLARLGLPPDYTILKDSENPTLEKEIFNEVKKLSMHLQEHIWIAEEIENICKFVVLGQAFTAMFSLVTSLYILSVETSFSPMLVAQLHYGMAILFQLSNYCIVGEFLTQWSADVSTGIYNSDWLSCTNTVKKSLIISLMRLQRPIYFTIGKFSPLQLNTILQILKASYSYFTFLQKT